MKKKKQVVEAEVATVEEEVISTPEVEIEEAVVEPKVTKSEVVKEEKAEARKEEVIEVVIVEEETETVKANNEEVDKMQTKKGYARYDEVDQEQLQIDLEAIKETIGDATQEDFKHLLKLEMWGRVANILGFFLIFAVSAMELSIGLGSFGFWSIGLFAAILIGVANVSRWANVTHPILHGAYDKVPNVPLNYTKSVYAKGNRQYIDWFDWIKPDAWSYEHNIMHHYHLGELDDPDNVEQNTKWITESKMPMWMRYGMVIIFAAMWKPAYYAPNTLRILENKERRKKKQAEIDCCEYSPLSKNGLKLWTDYIFPYAAFKFALVPLLFLPLGLGAVFNAFILLLIAEAVANLHSFLVIVPNHSADDIYQFETPHKSQGEFYLRQIMGSVNYCTGGDLLDASQGWLNYQIEHHLFPNLPLSQYQKMQPRVKELCAKHNLEYRQENVFKRMKMTLDLMVGKTKVLRIKGI